MKEQIWIDLIFAHHSVDGKINKQQFIDSLSEVKEYLNDVVISSVKKHLKSLTDEEIIRMIRSEDLN